MKTMKKILATCLALAMSCAAFSGCAAKDDTPAGSSSAASKAEAGTSSAAAEDEKVESISVMGIDWGYGPIEGNEMEKWWEEYFKVGLDVEWVSYKDYDTKLNTLLATGDIPDVIQIKQVASSFYYPVFTQAIAAGDIKDLTKPLFDDGFVKSNPVMSTWSDTIWDNCKFNGGTYIMPRGTSEVAPASGVNVRRDLMREFKMETEPKTMDELKTWLIDLAKKSKLYALDFSLDDFEDARVAAFATAFTGIGEWGIDANGEFVYQAFADGYIDFLNWFKDLYSAGVIDPEFILKQDATSNWKSGKSVAFLTQWYNWNQSEDRTTSKIFDKALPDTLEAWCLMPITGPKGTAVAIHPYGFGEAIAVNAKCSDAKTKKIIEIFNTTGEEYMDVLKNGVEGAHYDVVDGKRVSNDDQKKAKQEGYVGAWNQIFLTENANQIENKFVVKGASKEAITRATEIKAATEKAVTDMGLRLENLNLDSKTYASSWSTLTADLDDMRSKYVMGEITLDDWNTYSKGIVDSAEYKAILAEYKEAKAKQ